MHIGGDSAKVIDDRSGGANLADDLKTWRGERVRRWASLRGEQALTIQPRCG